MTTDPTGPRGRRFRPWQLAAAWLAATLAAVLVASFAVGAATRQVTDPTPVLLSQATASPTPSPSPSASPDDGPSDDPSPDDSPSDDHGPDDGPSDDPSPDDSPSDEDEPSPSGASVTRTASSIGGSASFRFEDGEITLLWARPEPGFAVDIEDEPGELRARFRSGGHESRIKADYEHGQPRIRVEERPEDDD